MYMSRVLLDTEHFYRGVAEDGTEHLGSYTELTELGCQDITWDDTAWEDASDHFKEFVNSLVDAHEKRYNSSTSYVTLAGTVGLWNGSPIGGRVINYDHNPLYCLGNVDRKAVSVDDDGVLTISGYHHDGTHSMNLYIITDSAIEKLEAKGLWDTPDGYAHIVSTRKPVKLPKKNNFY